MTGPFAHSIETAYVGRSSVPVSRVIFGGAGIGGLYAPVQPSVAQAALAAAWELGVRAFDTAPHYGAGTSESRIGDFLCTKPRSEFVVSTKVGRLLVPTTANVDGVEGFFGGPQLTRARDYSKRGVLSSMRSSLQRLQLDRVDIALVHDPDEHYVETCTNAIPALLQLRDEGTLGAVGVGMNQAPMLLKFVTAFDLDCVMIAGRYSLIDNSALPLLEECARRGVSVLVAGVFNSGLLVDPSPGATYDYVQAPAHLVKKAQLMAAACSRYDLPLAAAALQFPLRHPAVTAVLIGARSADEVREDVAYFRTPIPERLFDELEALRH